MKRTIYADRDSMVSQLQNARQSALDIAALAGTPRYRKQFWTGKAEGLSYAISLLRDWAGEEEPVNPLPHGLLRPHCRAHLEFRSDCRECEQENI